MMIPRSATAPGRFLPYRQRTHAFATLLQHVVRAPREDEWQTVNDGEDTDNHSGVPDFETPVFTACGSQVSTRVTVPLSQSYDVARSALAAVDAVHGDGLLRTVTVHRNHSRTEAASYEWNSRTGEPLRLNFSALAPRPEFSIIHELGHYLDHEALGTGTRPGSDVDTIRTIMEAISVSAAYSGLTELVGRKQIRLRLPGRARPQVIPIDAMTVHYLREPSELFARAYAQLIATVTQDKLLLTQLRQLHADPVLGGLYHSQWNEQDFVPIMRAFQQEFRSRRWIE